MIQHQNRLLSRAIERNYSTNREAKPRKIQATIYKSPPTLVQQIGAVLRVLSISNVESYMIKCQADLCLPWPGYKSQGYPQIKCGSSSKRFTVIQILAILFLEQPTDGRRAHERRLQRSCQGKSCVNILHYSYHSPNQRFQDNGTEASEKTGSHNGHKKDNV